MTEYDVIIQTQRREIQRLEAELKKERAENERLVDVNRFLLDALKEKK